MIVRSIDKNGDWEFGKGRNDYKRAGHAVAQNISTRLGQFLGDCFFARSAGIDWWGLLGTSNILGLKLAIRTMIVNTPGVSGVLELSVNLDDNRRITISYSVTTIYTNQAGTDNVVSSKTALILTEGGDVLVTESGDVVQA